MRFIGIDPGVSGALAVIEPETRNVTFYDTPTVQVRSGKNIKNVMDTGAIVLMLQSLSAGHEVFVTIEKVNAMPGKPGAKFAEETGQKTQSMGATSAFNFGMGFGMWLGIIAGLLLPVQQVHPLTWKKSMMADMGKEKDASRVKAMQLFPKTAVDLSRKKDHARGDALLIAEWGRRNWNGSQF